MKLPMNVWRKISTRLFIPTIALLFFIIISLTRLRLEDTTSLRPSDDVVGETPRRNLLHADTSKVKLEPISDIMSKDALPESRDRRQLLLQQFQLHDGRGNSNTDAAHPSEPYFVMTDEITGENLLTLKDGHDDHPLNRLADLRSPRNKEKETIFFFHVPKAHGGIIKSIMTKCFNLRRAEKVEDPESLTFVQGVLNIDTQTRKGLAQARTANLIDSGLVDVIVSSYFFDSILLFKPTFRGRAFIILRHPVYQLESVFYAQQSNRPELEGMALEEFVNRGDHHDNWLVRSLTNDMTGVLTEEHLMIAKGILARKFFIGVSEYLGESLKRLRTYYEWKDEESIGCVNFFLDEYHKVEAAERSSLERGDAQWNLIATENNFDMELYYYALEVFTKQGSTMFHRPYVDKQGVPIDFAKLKKEREEKEEREREQREKNFWKEFDKLGKY